MELSLATIPEKEKEAVQAVQNGLRNLATYVQHFSAALALFHHAEQILAQQEQHSDIRQAARGWKFLAGRDGAMTIYHFGIAAEGVRRALGLCPTLRPAVDILALRRATKACRSHFPAFEKMRHAVAHAAEKLKTPKQRKEHAVGGKLNIGQNFIPGNTFQTSWESEVLTYGLSKESLDAMESDRRAIWAAFPKSIHPVTF
jgi:hypothetical protein